MRVITVILPRKQVALMDLMIAKGACPSRSELTRRFVNYAMLEMIKEGIAINKLLGIEEEFRVVEYENSTTVEVEGTTYKIMERAQ